MPTAHDGFALPPIGFGTYRLTGASGVASMQRALHVGYRLLDSAVNYENEGAVGRAVRDTDVPREEIVVTSKLPGRHHAFDAALAAVEESYFRLDAGPIDLYLIHWPNPSQDRYVEAWRALVSARDDGYIREIGVSNFAPEQIERLSDATGVLPVVNQVELHPSHPQTELVAFHERHGIMTQAWSPIGRGAAFLEDPVITRVARQHDVTPVQAVLAWHVARGVVPIPKASHEGRQRENLAAADVTLSPADVDAITALGSADGSLRGWTPYNHEEF